jgi:hypothetical protein
MTRHGLKVTLLLIPSLATLVLLVYCLFSDAWVTINLERLHNVTVLYENEYNVVTGKPVAVTNLDRSGVNFNQVVNLRDKMVTAMPTGEPVTTTTMESTTTTTTPVTTEADMYEADDSSESTNHEEEAGEEYPAESGSSSENLIDKNSRARRQLAASRNSFFYITKLWPLTRAKGLYSECVQHFPFKLKISKSYLNQENKEPIIGVIDYLDAFNTTRVSKTCDEKNGQILCPLNKKCVTGKT